MDVSLSSFQHGWVRLRQFGWRHPEWWVLGMAGAAWIGLATGGMHAHPAEMPIPGGAHAGLHGAAGASLAETVAGSLPAAVAMVVAMMVPLTIANVRHVALSSLWRRRHRAMGTFLVGYMGVWIGILALLAGAWYGLEAAVGTRAGLAVLIVTATLWEIGPVKRRYVRQCHRTVPLAPRGWPAIADGLRYGAATGLRCAVLCGALMALCAAVEHTLWVMLLLFGIQLESRYRRTPAPLVTAAAVLITGALVLLRMG